MWNDEKPFCPLTGQWCNERCAWYLVDEVCVENEDRKYKRCAVVALVDATESVGSSIQYGLG